MFLDDCGLSCCEMFIIQLPYLFLSIAHTEPLDNISGTKGAFGAQSTGLHCRVHFSFGVGGG
jgi:hypothetical protein